MEDGLWITQWRLKSARASMKNSYPYSPVPSSQSNCLPRPCSFTWQDIPPSTILLRWKNGAKPNHMERQKGAGAPLTLFQEISEGGAQRLCPNAKRAQSGPLSPRKRVRRLSIKARPTLRNRSSAVSWRFGYSLSSEPQGLFPYNLPGCERAPNGSHAASCTKKMLQIHVGQGTNWKNSSQMIQCWLHIFSQLPIAQGLSQRAATACLVNNPPSFFSGAELLKEKEKKKRDSINQSIVLSPL